MFPYIRLFAPFRHYVVGFVFLTLIAYQTANILEPNQPPLNTNDPRLADVVAYEDLLKQKADQVLHRFGVREYTVDLSVTLDHTTVTTTTFDPGDPGSRKGETWEEEVNDSPRVQDIKVCVTIPKRDKVDTDQLFRSLSYALGIDLSRGDSLRIVTL